MPIDPAQVEAVFAEAVGHADAGTRAVYLEAACWGDADLRRRVDALLAAHEGASGFLTLRPIADATAPFAQVNERPGTMIGRYKLLEQIGEGGFGVVFLAEQEEPVRRRVALKVIKAGMDTHQVVARFEAERQALALMDHPNIAKVLDAGATGDRSGSRQTSGTAEKGDGSLLPERPDGSSAQKTPVPYFGGRPYFVMELVQGVPITDYCDQCNLPMRERLEMFVTVCQAVQHAHQKGVIHRDIKPTNVLVAMQDGQPAPKIIDFGVAKAIGQRLTDHTLTTAFAQMVGTPLYMSPEQAELSPLGVDTRSDIYSLGVLLYELLTGATPFDKDRLHSASYDELRRIIREEDPPRPSARISTLAADLATTVAERRRTDARRLQQTVRGELDWIVLKCLEKDRNRRYESASGLGRDIERYLRDEPVQACPPSASYRFRKFARRNKALLAAGSAIAAALFVGLGLSTWMYFRAATESARAQAVSDLLQEMLGSADAARAKGVDYTVRQLLDDFSAGLGSQLADQPAVAADIHATIGRAYRSVKRPDQAQPHFEQAIALRRQADGPQSVKLAAILVDGAWNLQDQNRHAEAESQLKEALEIYRRLGVTGPPLFHALEVLQHVLINAGRYADAERVTGEALDVARRAGQEFPDQANLLHRYAGLKNRQGQFAEAEKVALQSVDMHRRLHGERHPETAFGLRDLARALLPQRKYDEAEVAVREALTIFRRLFPDDHTNVRGTIDHLREVLQARNDKEALDSLANDEAERSTRANSPENHARLAGLLLKNSKPTKDQQQEARRLIQWAIEDYAKVAVEFPRDLDRRAEALTGYAQAAGTCGGAEGFEDLAEEINRRLEAELPKLLASFPDSDDCQWQSAMVYRSWAYALVPHSKYLPTVERAFRQSVEILQRLSTSDPQRPGLWLRLTDSWICVGDTRRRLSSGDVDQPIQKALEIFEQHRSEIAADESPTNVTSMSVIDIFFSDYFASMGRDDEAAEHLRQAARAAAPVKDPTLASDALFGEAFARIRLGDEAGYRTACAALPKLTDDKANDEPRVRQLWIWCLGPHPEKDFGLQLRDAEKFAQKSPLDAPYCDQLTLGGLCFRAGQFERATRSLNESIASFPDVPPYGNGDKVFPQLLLTMTLWQQGRHGEARELLTAIQRDIDAWIASPECPWFGRSQIESLRREAETMILGHNDAEEATEINSRKSGEPEP
jgi:serine/threonine protein kinase